MKNATEKYLAIQQIESACCQLVRDGNSDLAWTIRGLLDADKGQAFAQITENQIPSITDPYESAFNLYTRMKEEG